MKFINIEPTFEAWREAARTLLLLGITPSEVAWSCDSLQIDPPSELFADTLYSLTKGDDTPKIQPHTELPKVPKSFLILAESVSYHSSNIQWSLLYDVLYRITLGRDKSLLCNQTDPTIKKLNQLKSALRRDIHKMRAFVRFRMLQDPETSEENYIAWFEPEHRIVRVNASFFRKRFGGMRWSILTPYECVHWNLEQLTFSAGVSKNHALDADELEQLWLTYYKNIFNPARLKIKAMQSEMPKKYWKNLPEASVIHDLIESSSDQTLAMMESEQREVKPAPNNNYLNYLNELNKTELTED